MLIINAGSGPIPDAGAGWRNGVDIARAEANRWLAAMHADGLTAVTLDETTQADGAGRWEFIFRDPGTGRTAVLRTHGIDDVAAYEREHIFAPRVYWNGSSCTTPLPCDFAADPGH